MPQEIKGSTDTLGTGRRKTSVARVRIRPGQGTITINKRPLDEFFVKLRDRQDVEAPLEATGRRNEVDVVIRVTGGGTSGQAGACMLGIARALKIMDPELEPILRDANLLTRDSRMIERKKYGYHKARRSTQFSKR